MIPSDYIDVYRRTDLIRHRSNRRAYHLCRRHHHHLANGR